MDDSFKEPPLPAFKTKDEECTYWKERYNEIKQKLIETKQEFTDFEDNSRQLEAELETCLEQREKTIQDLKHSLDQLQTDNESLRVSYRTIFFYLSVDVKFFNSSIRFACGIFFNSFLCIFHRIKYPILRWTTTHWRRNIHKLLGNWKSYEKRRGRSNRKMTIWNEQIALLLQR